MNLDLLVFIQEIILMSTLMLELIGLLCMFIIIVTYFDSFGVEHIPKEIKAFVKNKNIKTNIFRVQSND